MKTTEELISDLIEERDYARAKLEQLSQEMIFRGNSVEWIYSKATNYKNAIGRCWDVLSEFGYGPDGYTDISEMIRCALKDKAPENKG